MHNPEWTRDELILGLDLYFRLKRQQISRTNPDIVALSSLLNDLPIHPAHSRDDCFRNPASVSMELRGFLRFDQHYDGEGLRCAKLGEQVWDEFSEDRDRLHKTAEAICSGYKELPRLDYVTPPKDDGDEQFPEGVILTRLHLLRERNPLAVRRKKERVQRVCGHLNCQVCGFDFREVYGGLGDGFAECHHCVPLSKLPGHTLTRLADLAIVCANCHRMLHRSKKWLTIAELGVIIAAQRGVAHATLQKGI